MGETGWTMGTSNFQGTNLIIENMESSEIRESLIREKKQNYSTGSLSLFCFHVSLCLLRKPKALETGEGPGEAAVWQLVEEFPGWGLETIPEGTHPVFLPGHLCLPKSAYRQAC